MADGLAFSTEMSAYCPPSLQNILIEVEKDVYGGFNLQQRGEYSLKGWAEQGVLLLNTALTVEQDAPESHLEIWKHFTNYVISIIALDRPGTIFLLWGGKAKAYKHLINEKNNFVLESGHPSPLSANKGHWFGNQHFSKTNEILRKQNGKEFEILW